MEEIEKGKLIYETKPDRGYKAQAWDIKDDKAGDCLIEIYKENTVIRAFKFPGYKVWNIGAHFTDIVTSEIEKNTQGYGIAASDGLGGSAPITPVL